MQLRGVVYHQIILNANFELFLFLRKSKTAFYFKVRFCYMQDCSFDSLLQGLFAKPFFLGDEYIVYYIQGLTSPYYGCARGYNSLFTCYYYMGISSNVKFSI